MPVFSKTLGSLDYSDPAAVRRIANHLRVMQEELEYRLAHLDSGNLSEINLDDTQVFSSKGGLLQLLNETDESLAKLSVRDDEISSSVQDLRRDAESSITQTAEKIELAVREGKEYTDGKLENYSSITQTANSIRTAVAESEARTVAGVDAKLEKYSTVEQTASSISSAVSESKTYTDQETGKVTASLQNYSTVEQTASKISSAVSESKTYTDQKTGAITSSLQNYSTVEQTASSISSAVSESKSYADGKASEAKSYTDEKTGAVAASLKNYSSIEQTASQISSAVTESKTYTDGKTQELSSTLTQTAEGITAQVNGLDGKYTALKTTVDGVTVTDDSGTTRVRGSSVETGSLNLTGSITFSDLDAAAQTKVTNAESAANGAANAASALANGSYPGTFINGRNIYTPNFYSDAIILYDGEGKAIGTMTMKSVETDAFDLTSYGSIRMISAPGYNAYMGVQGGPSLLLHGGADGLGARCQLAGGALVLDWDSFGYSLPTNPVDGQVFFLLES